MQQEGLAAGIPVRNLWLLLLYASDLLRILGPRAIAVEESPDDLPDLVASILAEVVLQRLRRNLSRGYLPRRETLSRVRGRIDWLETERKSSLQLSRVACRFESFEVDTERNRYVRSALLSVAPIVKNADVAHECRCLAGVLGHMGVSVSSDRRPQAPKDRLGRHDSVDAQMLAAARLAFELSLPTEVQGQVALIAPDRDIHWLRKLYERAVGGFFRHRLNFPWRVIAGESMRWPVSASSPGMASLLPRMVTDIVLEHEKARRIIIDTKFNNILVPGHHGGDRLRSSYVYQLYAYVRAREWTEDLMANGAEGVLLHPSLGTDLSEEATIHGHRMRFWTVDLAAEPRQIQKRLLEVASHLTP